MSLFRDFEHLQRFVGDYIPNIWFNWDIYQPLFNKTFQWCKLIHGGGIYSHHFFLPFTLGKKSSAVIPNYGNRHKCSDLVQAAILL